MKSIAIDMDNVIVDVESQYIAWYQQRFGLLLTKADLMGIPETEAFPDKKAVYNFLKTPGFFRTAAPLPGALNVVEALSKNFDVYIVSAAMEFPQSLPEKREWLQEYLPFISWRNIIFCGDKSIIATDYMIDDHVRNLQTFKGNGLLFTACHNVHVEWHTRLHNWDAVLKWFEQEQANVGFV